MRHVRRSAVCSRCANPEDLKTLGDQLLCLPCRTCPHDLVVHDDFICYACVREYFTAWTFAGPLIVDLMQCIAFCERHDIDLPGLLVWNFYEEGMLITYLAKISVSLRNQETNSANVPRTPLSPSEQNDTSPYPLLHHHVRGRTSKAPSGSSSR